MERVIRDPLMRGSEALCQLLRYLADRTLRDADAPLREHQIAVEVFGRTGDFDPRTDSTVRVQTSRLRSKLVEYYATSGKDDPWQIEIPKGTYSVVFLPGSLPVEKVPLTPESGVTQSWLQANLAPLGVALALLLVLLAGWAIAYLTLRPESMPRHSAINWFWGHLLRSSEEPLVVFSNAEFVGRPETGIRYRRRDDPSNLAIFDQYTGIGEVFAVHNIDRVLSDVHRTCVLKRGRLLNWDDTKGRDLIFIGSPSENLPLRQLPLKRDFAFSRADTGPRAGDLGIANLQPEPGESRMYFASPSSPMTEDYAVVELGWAGFTSQPILLLAGTTTFGTEAAVEFATSESKLKELRHRFKDQLNLVAFSLVLHVQIQGGVPLDSSVVAFRQH